MNTTPVHVTPLRIQERSGRTLFGRISNNIPENDVGVCRNIENALLRNGNVTLPLESPTNVGDLNRQRCNDSELELYIQSLTPKEHKAYLIAQSHLGMSFDLCKSRGFIEYSSKLNNGRFSKNYEGSSAIYCGGSSLNGK